MGCGISSLDQAQNPTQANILRRNRIVRPISDANPSAKGLLENGNASWGEGGDSTSNPNRKSVSSLEKDVNVSRPAKKKAENARKKKDEYEQNETGEREDSDRDDRLMAPGSPSFREYCIDSLPVAPSFNHYCTSDDDSDSKSQKSGNDIAGIRQNKPEKEEDLNPSKDSVKRERRGLKGFRKTIPLGMQGRKKERSS